MNDKQPDTTFTQPNSPPAAIVKVPQEHEKKYLETSNPLYVWAAYRWCREFGLPVPCFVYEYFDHVSEKFQIYSLLDPPRDVDAAVSDALGFRKNRGRKKGSFFSQKHKEEYPSFVALEVIGRVNHDQQITLAIADVAQELGISVRTVERALCKHEESFSNTMLSFKAAKRKGRRNQKKPSNSDTF